MKFLVVLAALAIVTIWRQDLDRINDSWFFRLRSGIEQIVVRQPQGANRGWFIVFVLTYTIPLTMLALILWCVSGLLLGFIALLIHLFVLLMAFDSIHPGALARQFQQHWAARDYEACYLFLETELGCTDLPPVDDVKALHSVFEKLYVYRCFERMFVTLFWYLVAGPLAVLFAYISYQLRYRVLAGFDAPEREPVEGIIQLLEWLPLRLLGLTLGLVGNFENCFSRFKRVGFANEVSTDQAVYEYSLCALDRPVQDDSRRLTPLSEQAFNSEYEAQVSGEIESLQQLMQRSRFAWLTVFALVTVLGWQI